MSALGRAALGGFAALMALILLGQLGARANRADDATSTVRRDGRSITVLFDRAAPAGPLGPGWAKSEPGKGALSADRTAYVLMPTSTAAGDVELCLVLASDGPRARPVGIAIDDHPIGVWTPRGAGQETACFVAPRPVRFRSYDLLMVFDLADGAPIRIISASSRIRPPPA